MEAGGVTLAIRQTHVGDCRELLAQMPDESVNCVVTSPPYWGLRDYGTATWEGGDAACAHAGRPKPRKDTSGDGTFHNSRGTQPAKSFQAVPVKSACACGATRVDRQLGLEETPTEYVSRMVDVFREVRRVLRSDGTLWLNLGDCYATGAGSVGEHPRGGEQGARWRGDVGRVQDEKRSRALRDGTHAGKHTAIAAMGPMTQPNRMPIPGLKPKDLVGIPWRVAFALQADGWWLRSDIVWSKPNPMPESVLDRPTKAHEYLFLLSKSEHYWYDAAAIREKQVAPEASTPDDAARAFSRRRQQVIDPHQPDLTADDVKRKRSGNRARVRRDGNGGVYGHKAHQAFGVPWEDADGLRNKRSVWTITTEPYTGAHFATFPTKLVEPCILAGCPPQGVVLDPFGGSGTVGQVAEALGRNWILLELNPEYAELARKRTAQRGLFVEAIA